MLWQCVRSAGSALLLGLLMFLSPSAQAQSALGSYTITANSLTVAGISSGGYMATQLQVAYSKAVFGTAVMAGGAYYCAQDDEAFWGTACATGYDVPVASLVSYTKQQASAGRIDPVSNLANKPIYMFSGTLDTVDYQATMDDLDQYYQSFTTASHITYNNTTPAEHSWVTPDALTACSYLALPYMNNCGIDPEQTFLTLFYGKLNARNNGQLGGSLIQFNQNAFCPSSNCAAISMDSTAWVFVPQSCAQGTACRLVVALHGCSQNQETVGTAFVQNAGINEWADSNNIIVLYPQTIDAEVPYNPYGCWDWWGYTNGNYALKSAPQMVAIMAEVNRLAGGSVQL
ncbi:extracellular catalytic domain type 2 short-chain-length polyhydroxyalkanoate depolymerase [Dyella acidiphila]|uniref:Poly(3-hydroxybutyrate) depolymerase n=1 Tax=Dyella acidiphila TaxID=2775866 RepID=A0ABR9GDX2_9GAMM|nr:PHB depolymerase family esterase [Dyella acidiphila]MBE1162216.1 poly(3-hydroxybutyrate) depolymerase [Dyella acidiphila]